MAHAGKNASSGGGEELGFFWLSGIRQGERKKKKGVTVKGRFGKTGGVMNPKGDF